jgi:ferredoxin
VAGVPVIAGRVPNVLLKFLNSVRGNGAEAVCVVLYGNRNYDDGLIELKDIMESNGFKVIAGGAFIGEHSFSDVLAGGRPDEKDLAVAEDFADMIAKKIIKNETASPKVNGMKPYRDYYKPKDKSGNPVDFRKITPKTKSTCINCGICAEKCPMGSIDFDDVLKLKGICIKCCACIKKCPQGAKYFDDTNFLKHKVELEAEYSNRREPELFL